MQTDRWYYILSSLVIFAAILLMTATYAYHQDKISDTLKSQLNLNEVYLQESLSTYTRLSTNVNKFILNDKINIDIFKRAHLANEEEREEIRKQLYMHLLDGYDQLRETGFRQLHYHLPDNHSFLRMHKPNVYGDDLSDIRYSVKMVNEGLKPVSGFEEGRVVNGFRFVFPLFDEEGTHIGSAESSVSSNAFIQHIEKTYKADVHFIILKEVVHAKLWEEEIKKHYAESLENADYYAEHKGIDNHFRHHDKNMNLSSLQKQIATKLKTGKKFVLFHDSGMIISFLPIRNIKENRVIAYFVVYDENSEILEANKIFLFSMVLIPLFALILLYFMRNEHRNRLRTQDMNRELSWRIAVEVEKSQRRDRKMMEQSRQAQMGEMISMIAHQWRQPLGAIAASAIDMQMKLGLQAHDLNTEEGRKACRDDFDQSLSDIGTFVENLTRTIDDFRNFYKADKDLEHTSLFYPLKKSLRIIQGSLDANGIEVEIKKQCVRKVHIHTNELMQVLLNLLKNAQDNFLEKKTVSPRIIIDCQEEGDTIQLHICDNGGGIPKSIVERIFDPYFSTKDDKNGTGLGLYMSKIIIEDHHNGQLICTNKNDGACFTIILPGGAE